ncbi:hypothetical protein QFZ43_004026 [Streptomyces afghaniensis]|nr:hypothetical protein [Streptomyces afghaniensis]
MEWLNAENLVAVATAVLGIIASGVMVWYERRVPRRKRIGYRVQMDNAIGDDVRSGRANRRLGLFDEAPDMTDATLVLLRIENDGSLAIDRDDYTGPEVHGLTAVFTDRTTHLARGNGQEVIRTHGHLPCWTPEGLTLCAQDDEEPA